MKISVTFYMFAIQNHYHGSTYGGPETADYPVHKNRADMHDWILLDQIKLTKIKDTSNKGKSLTEV